MKKILFITAYTPSDIGAAVKYTKNILNILSKKHEVDLIYFKDKANPETYTSKELHSVKFFNLSKISRIKGILLNPFTYPLFSVRYSRSVSKYINFKLETIDYDLIFLDHSQTFIYANDISIEKIFMSHDVIYQRTQRSLLKFLLPLCKQTERKLLSIANSSVFTFSEKDSSIIERLYNIKSYYTNPHIDKFACNSTITSIGDYYVMFGYWKRPDNYEGLLWFIKNVFSKFEKPLKLKIIGGGMSLKNINYIKQFSGVELLGFVENPYNLIANSKAMISPIFSGAGVKFKNLEALACGTPVIGTDIAFEGIPNKFSSFLYEAKTSEDFINIINSLNVSLNDRNKMKTKFVSCYQNHQIIDFIDKIK